MNIKPLREVFLSSPYTRLMYQIATWWYTRKDDSMYRITCKRDEIVLMVENIPADVIVKLYKHIGLPKIEFRLDDPFKERNWLDLRKYIGEIALKHNRVDVVKAVRYRIGTIEIVDYVKPEYTEMAQYLYLQTKGENNIQPSRPVQERISGDENSSEAILFLAAAEKNIELLDWLFHHNCILPFKYICEFAWRGYTDALTWAGRFPPNRFAFSTNDLYDWINEEEYDPAYRIIDCSSIMKCYDVYNEFDIRKISKKVRKSDRFAQFLQRFEHIKKQAML